MTTATMTVVNLVIVADTGVAPLTSMTHSKYWAILSVLRTAGT